MRFRILALLAVALFVATAPRAQPAQYNVEALSPSVSTGKPAYGYGETIEIRFTLANGSDEPATLVGTDTCQAQFVLDAFESIDNTICTLIDREIPIPARSERTWVWRLDPVELGLPNAPGPHTLVGYYDAGTDGFLASDTLTFEAPMYLGGIVGYGLVPGVELEALRPLMDSLQAEPIHTFRDAEEGHWGIWRILGVHLDSTAARYSADARFRYVEAIREVFFEETFVTSGEAGPVAATGLEAAAYPNPMRAYVLLPAASPHPERVVVEVYDGLGRLVLRVPERVVTAAPVRVEVGSLAAGVYVYWMYGGEVERSGRFTVVR